MRSVNPEKLFIELRDGVTVTEPVIGRRYTLTHSDDTADLFLTIGKQFAFDKVNDMRDEVIAEWIMDDGEPYLYVYIFLDGNNPQVISVRNNIFRRELPLALEAIRLGDDKFFEEHPDLDIAPIWIHFDSTNPEYDRFEYWGIPKDYNRILI